MRYCGCSYPLFEDGTCFRCKLELQRWLSSDGKMRTDAEQREREVKWKRRQIKDMERKLKQLRDGVAATRSSLIGLRDQLERLKQT